MVTKKNLVIAVLTTLCLASVLFTTLPIRSASIEWDPWADVSGPTAGEPDGKISMMDIAYEVALFNTNGTPINRTALLKAIWYDGLIGYWKLDEGTGNITSDSYYGHNDGTIYGAPWNEGRFGNALNFDGTDDYVAIPDLYSTGPPELTVSAWINSSLTKIGYVFYHGGKGEFVLHNGKRPDEFVSGDGQPAIAGFTVKLSNAIIYTVNSPSMTPSVWHNIVGVWIKGVTLRIYVDGQLMGENTAIPDLSLFDPGSSYLPTVGVYNRANVAQGTFFNGTIDSLMIYNRALSAEEVMEHCLLQPP